jgi:hypothetical protein
MRELFNKLNLNNTSWFDGLKYAEHATSRLGVEKAEDFCTSYTWGSSHAFDKGINDYFLHIARLKVEDVEPALLVLA